MCLCGPYRGRPRTFMKDVFDLLVDHCKAAIEEQKQEDPALAG
jgi:hypothetical protein